MFRIWPKFSTQRVAGRDGLPQFERVVAVVFKQSHALANPPRIGQNRRAY